MSEADQDPVWDCLVMPDRGLIGRSGEGAPVHFCRFSDEWTVFVVEQSGACCPQHSLCQWSLSYKGREVVSGQLQDLEDAKGLAVRCLEALIDFKPDLSSPEHHGFLPGPGGFDPSGFDSGAH